jgi:hypothetical protein
MFAKDDKHANDLITPSDESKTTSRDGVSLATSAERAERDNKKLFLSIH